MGGAGALAAGTTHRFAAVVPVAPAGGVPPKELLGTPVWAFHGKNDVVVPYSYSEHLITKLRGLGANDSRELSMEGQSPQGNRQTAVTLGGVTEHASSP